MLLLELPQPVARIENMAARAVTQKDVVLFVGNIGTSFPEKGERDYPKKQHHFITVRCVTL